MACITAAVLCSFSTSCATSKRSGEDLALYRITNDQAGHEWAKTEQFLGPVGSVTFVDGLRFPPGVSTLDTHQKLIVQDVFNCLEEITENTVNDTNVVRVAEHKKMEFEIRGYPDESGSREEMKALSQARAQAVVDWLTYLGTPPWRLKASGAVSVKPEKSGRVEFVRTK